MDAGRGLVAIYLWGYAAEMTLKAAYFSRVKQFGDSAKITMRDINTEIDSGRKHGIHWPNRGQGHNVRAWAESLVAARRHGSTPVYTLRFASMVQANALLVSRLWSETLRYRVNVPYAHEIRQVQSAANWFLLNYERL